jgi:hypothetical protein
MESDNSFTATIYRDSLIEVKSFTTHSEVRRLAAYDKTIIKVTKTLNNQEIVIIFSRQTKEE